MKLAMRLAGKISKLPLWLIASVCKFCGRGFLLGFDRNLNSDTFNSHQRRYLLISLLSVEKALRKTTQLLTQSGETGVLFVRKPFRHEELRDIALKKINCILEELETFIKQLALKPLEEDSTRMIVSELTMSWAGLEDCHSSHLKGYGELNPQTADWLDERIEHFASQMIELTRILSTNQSEGLEG